MMWMRGLLRRLGRAGRPARRGRADLGALLGLDDRMLADIGLRRAEVTAAASGQLPLSQLTVHGPVDPGDLAARPRAQAAPADRKEPERWDAAA